MNRIDQTFATLKRAQRKALIGYVTAGLSDESRVFPNIVPRLEKAGLGPDRNRRAVFRPCGRRNDHSAVLSESAG